MKIHRALDDTVRDLAIAYASGELSPSEVAAHDRHMSSCAVCRDETAAASTVLAELVPAAVIPSPTLRSRLLERIHAAAAGTADVQTWKRWTPTATVAGFSFIGAGERAWETTASPGVEVSRLSVSPDGDRVTMLIRMSAGASYPAHRHGGREECFVLEGDLHADDWHMKSGDYLVAEEGSAHGVQESDNGCLLLIVSSVHDELIAEHAH